MQPWKRNASAGLVSNESRRTARELLQAYKTPFVVEQDNALTKGPLAIAPLYLKDTNLSFAPSKYATLRCPLFREPCESATFSAFHFGHLGGLIECL